MFRMIRWLTPVLALGLVASFSPVSRAEEKTGTGTLKVEVKDAEGKAVANAQVRVIKPTMDAPAAEAKPQAEEGKPGKGDKRGKPVAQGTTGEDGKCTIENVPAGDLVVQAGIPGTGRGMEKISLKAGETKEVSLKLKPMKEGAPGAGGKKPKDQSKL
jgi:hypothetical protein